AVPGPRPPPVWGAPGGGGRAPPAPIPAPGVTPPAGGGERSAVRFGHPSGTLRVGAEASQANGEWTVTKAIMSRSARILMEGWVRVPGDAF
ncbi:2-methylaconitate cis-trans isomerase PrpF family protein, partial [Pseudomonas aeruginosa]|uniref:2-methylaconitate cis-trans isomerase PrpF family protein n=1 Tax=Pseudomonas aeruginosa TaxID=287 RepID=UPI0021F1BF34